MAQEDSFSPFRRYLWPIYFHELPKFLPLFFMAFFISCNYNILRNMKDTLLVTAEHSGAEVLPFIKVWGIVPAAFLITALYSKLNNHLTQKRVFYSMVTGFLCFFAFFSFVIYPLRESLHLHHLADRLQAALPAGFKGLIAMIRYWSFSSFYIMSELWSSTVLTMLFWGFANHVTQVHEAKRFYGLITTGLNVAAIVAGQISVLISSHYFQNWLHLSDNQWDNSLFSLTLVVLVSGVGILLAYAYLSKKIEPNLSEIEGAQKSEKLKMSMRENIAYLRKSKYLLYITILVLSYNILINLIEVLWKDQVRQLYPDPNAYNTYMNHITTWTGVLACTCSYLISAQLIRKCGWTFVALLAPICFLITTIGFFTFFFGQSYFFGLSQFFNIASPMCLTVLCGAIQITICRGVKFTFFDITKEMAFIPLSLESKLKGKAVIDGVGSRIGKSGGSLIHQTLLVVYTTIGASAGIVAGIMLCILMVWVYAASALGKKFNALIASQQTVTPEPQPTRSAKPRKISALS